MKKNFIACLIVAPILFLQTNILTAQVNVQDSLALVDFYNSTDGQNWTRNTNWLTTAPVATWYGITVTNNRVSVIYFYDNKLNGTLPASIGNLEELTTLSINYSQRLRGAIPHEIGKLVNLTGLNFTGTRLAGKLPEEIGNLTKLKGLSFWGCAFTGKIPDTFRNLTALESLALYANQFSGEIPGFLAHFTHLTNLNLGTNQFTGTIPEQLGDMSTLTQLDLSDNQLTGTIPSSFGRLSNLGDLYLYENQLTGPPPASLLNLTKLSSLNIYNNNFTFAGLGRIVSAINTYYSSQAKIPVNRTGNMLSVSVGSVPSNNTFKWYRNGELYTTKIGDSTFTITKSGTYNVRVTNSVAKALTLYSEQIKVTISLVDNLIAAQINSKISSVCVYPNPAKANATILFNADGKYTITLADVSGRTLQTKTGIAIKGTNTIQLDVSNIASGMYLITVTDEKNTKQTVNLNKE